VPAVALGIEKGKPGFALRIEPVRSGVEKKIFLNILRGDGEIAPNFRHSTERLLY